MSRMTVVIPQTLRLQLRSMGTQTMMSEHALDMWDCCHACYLRRTHNEPVEALRLREGQSDCGQGNRTES